MAETSIRDKTGANERTQADDRNELRSDSRLFVPTRAGDKQPSTKDRMIAVSAMLVASLILLWLGIVDTVFASTFTYKAIGVAMLIVGLALGVSQILLLPCDGRSRKAWPAYVSVLATAVTLGAVDAFGAKPLTYPQPLRAIPLAFVGAAVVMLVIALTVGGFFLGSQDRRALTLWPAIASVSVATAGAWVMLWFASAGRFWLPMLLLLPAVVAARFLFRLHDSASRTVGRPSDATYSVVEVAAGSGLPRLTVRRALAATLAGFLAMWPVLEFAASRVTGGDGSATLDVAVDLKRLDAPTGPDGQAVAEMAVTITNIGEVPLQAIDSVYSVRPLRLNQNRFTMPSSSFFRQSALHGAIPRDLPRAERIAFGPILQYGRLFDSGWYFQPGESFSSRRIVSLETSSLDQPLEVFVWLQVAERQRVNVSGVGVGLPQWSSFAMPGSDVQDAGLTYYDVDVDSPSKLWGLLYGRHVLRVVREFTAHRPSEGMRTEQIVPYVCMVQRADRFDDPVDACDYDANWMLDQYGLVSTVWDGQIYLGEEVLGSGTDS